MSTFVTTEKLSRLMDAVKAKIATKLDATGIKNDALTTDAGYVLDARMGKTLGDRTTSLETKVSDLYFATDSNGKWGYKATKNGAVTPFRNPTGDATAAEVLSGNTFSSATLENATGTMTNNGAWTGATTGEGSITIPAGYHNGSGSVSGKTSYNDGYTNGYSTGRSSTRTLKCEIEGIVQGEGDIWSRFDVYLIDSSGSKTLIHRQMGAGTSDFSVEVTDSMWSD